MGNCGPQPLLTLSRITKAARTNWKKNKYCQQRLKWLKQYRLADLKKVASWGDQCAFIGRACYAPHDTDCMKQMVAALNEKGQLPARLAIYVKADKSFMQCTFYWEWDQ